MPFQRIASKLSSGALLAPVAAYEIWARLIVRGIQFIFALIVVGLYGHRVDVDRRSGLPQNVNWMYALAVGAISSITCILFALPIPMIKSYRFFIWDAILFIFWVACFGVFGKLYLHQSADKPDIKGADNGLMKIGVWIDLINVILWFGTAIYGACRTMLAKRIDKTIGQAKEKAMAKIGV